MSSDTASTSLEAWGLGSWYRLAEEPSDGPLLGRVLSRQASRFELATRHGPRTAELSGRLTWLAADADELPVAGDWVLAWFDRPADPRGLGLIIGLCPRQGVISRLAPGGSGQVQVIAANVDRLVAVWPLDRAETAGDSRRGRLAEDGGDGAWMRWGMIERILTMASAAGVEAALVLTKADLHERPTLEALRAEAGRRWPDLPVYVLGRGGSGLDRHADLLSRLEPASTTALVGLSGAGKSTLLNDLAGAALAATGGVRDADGKGRHTTTHREIHALPGGALILDNPGIRELGLAGGRPNLDAAFPDVAELAARCRFADCAHEAEPGCAIRAALESGELPADVWARYRKQEAELAWLAARTIRTAASGTDGPTDRERWEADADRRKWKQISKTIRKLDKGRRGGE